MHAASWNEIVHMVITLVSREQPFVQILFWLGVALGAALILEGIRANFIPKRKPASSKEPRSARSQTGFSGSSRARASAWVVPPSVSRLPNSRKMQTAKINPHRAPRPVIRRVRMAQSPLELSNPEPPQDQFWQQNQS